MINWYKCYGQKWGKEVSAETIAHPAKFSRLLIKRIYELALEKGWLKSGDTVLDCFAGTGLGAIDALFHGLNWIGNELEWDFIDIGNGVECTGITKKDWERFYGRWDKANRKDGRYWCPECLGQLKADVIDDRNGTQPSLFNAYKIATYVRNSGQKPHTHPHYYKGNLDRFRRFARDGAQAVLMQGDSRKLVEIVSQVRGIVSSPPYIDSLNSKHHGIDFSKTKLDYPGRVLHDKRIDMQNKHHQDRRYGDESGQMGAMREGNFDATISSPMLAGNSGGRGEKSRKGIDEALFERHSGGMVGGVGVDERNMGSMRPGDIDAVISSPPFQQSVGSDTPEKRGGLLANDPKRRKDKNLTGSYGDSEGQLAIAQKDTFWSASHLILEQCFHILAPGKVSIWVLKNFVRDGEIVNFSSQWQRLCEAVGFEHELTIRAWLVEEEAVQLDFDQNVITTKKSKKSFFRRLQEQKGLPPIDWEIVLVMKKPL